LHPVRQIASKSKHTEWPMCLNMSRSSSLNERRTLLRLSRNISIQSSFQSVFAGVFEHANYWCHVWCHRSIQPTHHARCWCKRIACRWSLKMEAAKFHRVVSEQTRSNYNRPPSKAWRTHRFPIWAARMKSSQSSKTIKTPWKPP